ncbi:unnamed protein product [Rhizoctonia solani]|uniref:Transmembrane protein n=1 Tax=Rhizoctonia solani TaxID=456999 RepID=A0A8H3GBH7_9AGAM|nr:unnamed protein product [Rhizoctonia solani]
MASVFIILAAITGSVHSATSRQSPTECADGSMTLWMHNNDGKNPCELVQDVLRVCDPSFSLGFLPRGYTCDNSYGSALSPCCCGSPTFALMSACWSCQYNITFDLVSTTFTGFVKDCQTLPNPITSYDTRVRGDIAALDLPPWSQVEPLAGKWDFAGAWRNSTPSPTVAPPVPTGYPVQVNSTGISKGALAGAIVGAILGSKILFMLAGYLFYRWWKKQPGRDDDDDERGYVHHVFGEPKYPRRAVTRRSRKGSRAHVDLDEDTASPRSSRWLGVPSYLQPTSFHSHSSAGTDSPVTGQQELNPHDALSGPHARGAARVTPYFPDQRPVESEKARERRRSQSNVLHIANTGGTTSDEENRAPIPQPGLLPHPPSVSSGPGSPPAVSNSLPILLVSRSNSHADSSSTSNLPEHPTSTGSGSGSGYQEDDAGYRIVIEDENGGQEAVRSVPPAYVDYRQGYSNAGLDKGNLARQGSAQADGSNNTHGGSSQSTGSEAGRPGGLSDNTSATCINSSSSDSRPPSLKKGDAEGRDTDTIDAKTMTETNTLREPQIEPDHRDRTESGDSEGAVTIKPPAENPRPVERSSTSDLAALTAANTAANRPNTSGSNASYHTARPSQTTHISAPAGVTFVESMPQHHDDSEHDVRQTSDDTSLPKNEPPPATTSSAPWSWGRALGAFGLGGTSASSS